MKTYKQDHKLMEILKVNEISRFICDTNFGPLKLRIRKGETTYQFTLDSVEIPKDVNNEIMKLLYSPISEVDQDAKKPSKSKGGRPKKK